MQDISCIKKPTLLGLYDLNSIQKKMCKVKIYKKTC